MVLYAVFLRPERILSPKGQHISRLLPDGSEVQLNADSELSYTMFDLDGARKVHLKGEAYFQHQNRRSLRSCGCKMELLSLRVQVSTSINATSNLEVACFSGSVQVSNNEGIIITLNAGEITRTKNQTLTPSHKIQPGKRSYLANGRLLF